MARTDIELLRHYQDEGREADFAEFVQRHVSLVYSVALRRVHSPQIAEEVAQTVFLDLAQKIPQLQTDTQVIAWLHQLARRTAIDAHRRETRRTARELEAFAMNAHEKETSEWNQIKPLLDDSLAGLPEPDRAAVLLRFMEGKSFREIGASIGLSEDAAQKRVARALEKLRGILQRQGVTVGAGALAVVLSSQAIQAAPAALAPAIAVTVAKTVTVQSLAVAASKTIFMSALKNSVVALALAGTVALVVHEVNSNRDLRQQNADLQQQLAEANARAATAMPAAPSADNSGWNVSLAKLRAENGDLARQRDEAARLAQLYKQLADDRGNLNATNQFPSRRHLTAGLGRMLRKQLLGVELFKGKDMNNLTPEDRKVMNDASADMMTDLGAMMKAAVKLKSDPHAETARDPADDMAVLTYGLLDLNEQQFQQAYQLFQGIQQEVVARGLDGAQLSEADQQMLQGLNERGVADFQKLLNAEQQPLWKQVIDAQPAGEKAKLFGNGGLFQNFTGTNGWEGIF